MEENINRVVQHFLKIFNEPESASPHKAKALEEIMGGRRRVVTATKAAILDKDLSQEEIRNTILSLQHKKSPGIDGLPAEFFQVFIDVMVDPLHQV